MEYQKNQKIQKIHNKVIRRQLQMTKERYISPEKKTKKYWQSEMNHNSTIMEYQKIINLLVNTQNQLGKFRIKKWVEVNDESSGTYNLIVKLNLKLQF